MRRSARCFLAFSLRESELIQDQLWVIMANLKVNSGDVSRISCQLSLFA